MRWTGKEIGADLGPEERRLYRQIPGNQGVPALPSPPSPSYGGGREGKAAGPSVRLTPSLPRPYDGEVILEQGKRLMGRAFVFPGQGSQAVGMGVDLAGAFATARDVFHEIDEALKQNLSKLMREGPESDLVLTENAQPALMAVSIAVIRVLEKDGGKPLASLASHVAGHSLGEYSALTAARALLLADAARLLQLRGQSMQKA